MNLEQIVSAINAIEQNRNISKSLIMDAISESLIKAYRREIEVPDAWIEVIADEDTGEIHIYHNFLVVEEVEDDELEVSVEELKDKGLDLNVGDTYRIEKNIQELGRASASLAKNVIKQIIREEEKKVIFDEFNERLFDLTQANIESVKDKFLVVDLGKALAIMPKSAQMPNEHYYEGKKIRVVITEVNKETKGAQILVSRASDMLVKRLFEEEVPEYKDGLIEIKAIAREAGDRTKIAVYSHDEDIDPVGAFIGKQGYRIQAIKNELMGENIDIFEWSDNLIELVKNALAPAEVLAVFENPENKGLMVVVDNDQLSLAIGKRGKNARLAYRLTNQRIDIKSVDEAFEEEIDYVALMAAFEAKLNQEQAEKEMLERARLEEAKLKARQQRVEVDVEVDEEDLLEIDERDLDFFEEVVDEAVEEVIDDVKEDAVEEVIEDKEIEKVTEVEVEDTTEEDEEEILRRRRPLLKPRSEEFVSKFEEIADASRRQETPTRRRYRRQEKEEEVVSTSELLKDLDYEIAPEYTEEQLEDIRQQQEYDEKEWYDEDIDFEDYDDYYD